MILVTVREIFVGCFLKKNNCSELSIQLEPQIHTPHIVDLVILDVTVSISSCPAVGRLQFPVVQAVQEHLGQVVHRLPFLLVQVAKLVHHKVCHALQYTA